MLYCWQVHGAMQQAQAAGPPIAPADQHDIPEEACNADHFQANTEGQQAPSKRRAAQAHLVWSSVLGAHAVVRVGVHGVEIEHKDQVPPSLPR